MRTITRFNQGPRPASQTTILVTPMRHLIIQLQMTSDRYRIGLTAARAHPLWNPLPLLQRSQWQWMNYRKKFSLFRLPRKARRSRNLLRNGLCLNLIDRYSIISWTAGSSTRRNANIWTWSNCWCYCRLIINLVNGLVNVHYYVNSHPLVNGQLDQKGKGCF